MRKYLLLPLLLILVLFIVPAQAETLQFPDLRASCEISDDYIILTPETLSLHKEWMLGRNTNEEEILADWQERGVLAQAWNKVGDAVLEITAVQDGYAKEYFDIDEQTKATRAAYRKYHLSGEELRNLGYTISSAEWKNTAQGRFLMLQYKKLQNGETYHGRSRKTIKNGYTINLDYQVYGRGFTAKDNSALDKIWNTWTFSSTLSGVVTSSTDSEPAAVSSNKKFDSIPPVETSTGKFTVSGTCNPGLRVLGVVMRMSSTQAFQFEDTASKNGKFSLPVQLPEEGVWFMTVSFFDGDTFLDDAAFNNTITYQSSLLIVNLDNPLPTSLNGDSVTISGTTVRQTNIQCIVEGPSIAMNYNKKVTTNNSGAFSFKIPTTEEGDYTFTLVFEKKTYSTRKFSTKVSRKLSETDKRTKVIEEAIKPAYATLSKRISSYLGRYMTYEMYVTSVSKSGDGWVVFMAMRSTATGYKDIVVVECTEEPQFGVGTLHRMYGMLNGTYQVLDTEEGNVEYPCFTLSFWGD